MSIPRPKLRHCFITLRQPESGRRPRFGASKIHAHFATLWSTHGTYRGWLNIDEDPSLMTPLAKNSPKERDNALLAAIAAGDRRALEELYLSYHRRVARVFSPF